MAMLELMRVMRPIELDTRKGLAPNMTKNEALEVIFKILKAETPELQAEVRKIVEIAAAPRDANVPRNAALPKVVQAAAKLDELLNKCEMFSSNHRPDVVIAGSILQQDPEVFRQSIRRLASLYELASPTRLKRGRTPSEFADMITSLTFLYKHRTKGRVGFSRRPDGTPYGRFVDYVRAISYYSGRTHISDAQIEHAIRFAKTQPPRIFIRMNLRAPMPEGWENWPCLRRNHATSKKEM
jgi:hypothetical protein